MCPKRAAVIVGAALSDEMGEVPGKSSAQHHAEAAYNALKDAGLKKDDVDGYFTTASPGGGAFGLAEYMGLQPSKVVDTTSVGGSSFELHLAHAVDAIAGGRCEVALVTHGQAGRSTRGFASEDPTSLGSQYDTPYGIIGPPQGYALAGMRYMHQYGEQRTREAWAEIAVATRKWAQLNPRARMREPMTFEDYHNSRWITYPFHILDCCLVTDGGGAFIVTTPERARDLPKKPVWILGYGEGMDHGMVSQMPDLTQTVARDSGKRALAMAGVTHKDVNLAMIYDSFTYTVLTTLESLGFCGRGEGPDFVKGQRTAPGGNFPMNTSGGGLSYTHTGMYGMFLIVEAVQQLRGEGGQRQLPNCKLVLVNGTGGNLAATGTVILAVD